MVNGSPVRKAFCAAETEEDNRPLRVQKIRRAPIWIWRAGLAELTTPKDPAFKLTPGGSKLVWLNALKNSPRNCSRARSTSAKVRSKEKSEFTTPGARSMPTP